MIAAIALFWKRILCRHVPAYDGFDPGCLALIVRTKCSRCGKIERSGQPVNKRFLP